MDTLAHLLERLFHFQLGLGHRLLAQIDRIRQHLTAFLDGAGVGALLKVDAFRFEEFTNLGEKLVLINRVHIQTFCQKALRLAITARPVVCRSISHSQPGNQKPVIVLLWVDQILAVPRPMIGCPTTEPVWPAAMLRRMPDGNPGERGGEPLVTQTCTLRLSDGKLITAQIHTRSPDETCPVFYAGAVERLPFSYETADVVLLRVLFQSFARELGAQFEEQLSGSWQGIQEEGIDDLQLDDPRRDEGA